MTTDARVQIRELIDQYFYAVDANDQDALAGCFAENAEFQMRIGTPHEKRVVGRQAIVDALHLVMGTTHKSVHVSANAHIRSVTGAAAESTTFVVANLLMGETVFVRGTRLDDQMVLQSGKWVFQKRVHAVIWQYANPAIIPPYLSTPDITGAKPTVQR